MVVQQKVTTKNFASRVEGEDAEYGAVSRMSGIIWAYQLVKEIVSRAGFAHELSWQASRNFQEITETAFLREYAWVALSAGMRESIIRQRFHSISWCFFGWESAETIAMHGDLCRRIALRHFGNCRKIGGIVETAKIVNEIGFSRYKEMINSNPMQSLRMLPFIGPITCYHLAKNIGLLVAKPDRHLVRLADSVGYLDVQELCRDISFFTGDAVPVVDIVLWRFATLTDEYIDIFRDLISKQAEIAGLSR